ncbi:MAG: DUF3261 domain-containing protein [Rhodospirillaceae bacterium]
MPATLANKWWITRQFPILLVLLVTGCATVTLPPEPVRSVSIATGVMLTLPPSSALDRTVEAAQLVTARYRDQTFLFEGRISVTPERFLLVGLDTMGRRALTVTWTADGVTLDAAPWLPDTLKPGNMLADIVLIYWPEATVRAALSGASLEAGPMGRSVRNADGAEIVNIVYGKLGAAGAWSGRLRLSNLARGYDIEVQSEETPP